MRNRRVMKRNEDLVIQARMPGKNACATKATQQVLAKSLSSGSYLPGTYLHNRGGRGRLVRISGIRERHLNQQHCNQNHHSGADQVRRLLDKFRELSVFVIEPSS